MGDRYLVTRTPDRMLRHWGRMQMYITYMGMFWGKTLWLVVCVLCGLGSWVSGPQRGCGGLLDPGLDEQRPVWDRLARDSHYGVKNIETDPTSYRHLQHTIHPPPILIWLCDKRAFLAPYFSATVLLMKPHGCQLDEPPGFCYNHQRYTIASIPNEWFCLCPIMCISPGNKITAIITFQNHQKYQIYSALCFQNLTICCIKWFTCGQETIHHSVIGWNWQLQPAINSHKIS